MKKFKKRCMLAIVAMAMGAGTAYAAGGDDGKDYRPYPHMFFGLNGGASVSFSNYDFGKLIHLITVFRSVPISIRLSVPACMWGDGKTKAASSPWTTLMILIR